jgi:probable rRNA maturation factor
MPPWVQAAHSYVQKILEKLALEDWELSVLFCNNRYIKSLNAQFRNKDEATDVLSFPLGEQSPEGRFLAGDIVISLEALEENARFFKVSQDEELRRLLIHAILHLSGEIHAGNEAEEPMLKIQEKLLAQVGEKIL